MIASQKISDAVTSFALKGAFPDDASSLPPVSETDLKPTIQALAEAKSRLEAEVHEINEETREEVRSWEKNAKSLQEDIVHSKKLASDLVRQSEAPETSGELVEDAEEKTDFLNREVQYSTQLYGVLKGIQQVNRLFDDVEKAKDERRVLDALRSLEKSSPLLDQIGVSRSCRVMRLLDIRYFELRSDIHTAVDSVWKELVQIDAEAGQVLIHDKLQDNESMTLSDAVIGLKAYKEVDERMEQLWRNIDAAVLTPRMDKSSSSYPKIRASGDSLELDGSAEPTVEALMADLKTFCTLVAHKLPRDLLDSLCRFMMVDLIPRLVQDWLTPAIPTSLSRIPDFDRMIEEAGELCRLLEEKGYSNYDDLQSWVDNAPNIWLGKCTETALDTVRVSLSKGIGQPRQVEKIEKHMVSMAEGKELATTGAGATAETNDWGDDWGDAWDDDDQGDGTTQEEATTGKAEEKGKAKAEEPQAAAAAEDDGADAWGWDEEAESSPIDKKQNAPAVTTDDDDSAAAWGWGDEDIEEPTEEPVAAAPSKDTRKAAPKDATRELVLKETYHISSMPEPLLELIAAILEDGAMLVKDGDRFGHVAATANGLFVLPTYVLALFRAISPHFYAIDGGGNMFLYNDAMYLAEQLSTFSTTWQRRQDLTDRAKGMLNLTGEVTTLQGFANRSYTSEMNTQKTVLRDLIGGAQSLTGQDEWEAAIEAGTARIRTMAAAWETVLARSVWSQAVGSLAEALATKLITDVVEMASIGQDEAYSIAKAITTATELDDLFLPSRLAGTPPVEDEVATTAQYAPSWLRLKYLSEVLQSNLNEVKYLWLESELSLYFTVDEVVDLIEASFEKNYRTREAIREIQARPQPLAQTTEQTHPPSTGRSK